MLDASRSLACILCGFGGSRWGLEKDRCVVTRSARSSRGWRNCTGDRSRCPSGRCRAEDSMASLPARTPDLATRTHRQIQELGQVACMIRSKCRAMSSTMGKGGDAHESSDILGLLCLIIKIILVIRVIILYGIRVFNSILG